MHIAIITAGGAGMFCGSCMHDNTWARALMDIGVEVSLIPTYTPIRVDEQDVSDTHVFMGGLNIYMDHRSRLWRRLPRFLTRPLDHPAVLRLLSKLSISNDAADLGDLTLDMLAGESGPIAREVDELAEHIAQHLKPDIVIFSNALLVGALKRLKERFEGPVYCTLQGDDVFTDGLPESHKPRVIEAVSARAQQFDGFFTHSRFYRDYMGNYLQLRRERMHVIPLGIDLMGHHGQPKPASQPFTVGYFARIAPEKGLHYLMDAALLLHSKRPGEFRYIAGGYLNPQHRSYFSEIQRAAAPLGDAFEYIGSPASLADKVAFYQSLDVLSVPTEFLEPKGLYVLEALANGVPVIQPNHGAFPELIESTGGGQLVEPKNPEALAKAIERLADDTQLHQDLSRTGHTNVREKFNPKRMAEETLKILTTQSDHEKRDSL
ncbi:MAG: glycosyltransferase family 4 protein [Planctomycetaceae bacterium]|nr:glycosyltransferase family 4 protein [Planctomycetaceae bacterium]